MAAAIFEGREILISRLQKQLGTLVSSVEIAGQNNLSSTHVVAETTLAGLLNRVYGWKLINANAIKQNCPGVDLVDADRNIAIQVTATRTAEKVRHTLEEVAKSGILYKKLVILTITNAHPTPAMLTCTVPSYTGSVEIWNIPDVFRDAKELDPIKLDELTKYMEAELGPIRERVKELPHLELPPSSALQSTGFVGRELELAEIQSRFAQGDRLVILTGLGGMGKTELAVRFGREHPGLVYFVRFDTSFTRTLANMVHGICPKLHEEELRLEESILVKKVQTMLERSNSDDLLIIDNVDSDISSLSQLQADPGYKTILDLPLKLLMTTRSDVPRAIPVKPMPEEPLFEIFRNHGTELTEAEMRELIRAVNGHTLTIDLIARTLADNWVPVSAQEMLDAIVNSTLSEEDFPEVGTDYNNDPEQLHIYQRLRSVFQVAKIPEMEQQLLKLATLLPETGMDMRLFRKALPNELLRTLPEVGRRGWLSAEQKILTIHPVIRLVCQTELQPKEADCEAFLEKLWEQYDPKQHRPNHYSQMAELFTLAHDRLGKHHGRWLNWAGILLNDLAQSQKLHDLYHTRLLLLEEDLPKDSTEIATVYNYYGISLGELGHYSLALEYSQKALSIRKTVLLEDDVNLARSYNNVGWAYGFLGNHQTALDYQLNALDILKAKLPSEHLDLAQSYSNVGIAYHALGKYQEALEYLQYALNVCSRAQLSEHPILADIFDNIGSIYGNLGEYRKAQEYHLKALDIRQIILSPDHPNLANSYNNVGASYSSLGNYHKAQEYHLKALDIRKEVLPPEHPDLARSYDNVGGTYSDLGNYHKALEHHEIAMNIREKSLPPGHSDLARSYNNIGSAYFKLGNHHEALKCAQIAMKIWEESLAPEHPDLALSYCNIAWSYHKMGYFINAAQYMHQAADIISRSSLPDDHPNRVSFPQWAAEFEKKAAMQRNLLSQPMEWGRPSLPFPKK